MDTINYSFNKYILKTTFTIQQQENIYATNIPFIKREKNLVRGNLSYSRNQKDGKPSGAHMTHHTSH